ncbi:unnamed protein product, partial [Ectocarpus sp. 13 AM-2016]
PRDLSQISARPLPAVNELEILPKVRDHPRGVSGKPTPPLLQPPPRKPIDGVQLLHPLRQNVDNPLGGRRVHRRRGPSGLLAANRLRLFVLP